MTDDVIEDEYDVVLFEALHQSRRAFEAEIIKSGYNLNGFLYSFIGSYRDDDDIVIARMILENNGEA